MTVFKTQNFGVPQLFTLLKSMHCNFILTNYQ